MRTNAEAAQRVAIVADDLTGALDAGLQLSRRGVETRVSLRLAPQPEAPAMVINADTRAVTERTALGRMAQAARLCVGRAVFKKIDSTLRGHVGPEAIALRNALGLRAAVVAPTFVAAGRTVQDGRLLVNGIPVHETSLARDPAWPTQTDLVISLVGRGVNERITLAPLALVRAGPEALGALISERGLYVAESAAEADLETVACVVCAHLDQVLPCGSAGLASAWASALGLGGKAPLSWEGESGPVLLVCGSRNQVTQKQLEVLVETRHPVLLEIDPSAQPADARSLGHRAAAALSAGECVVLSAGNGPLLPGAAMRIARALGQAALAALWPAKTQATSVAGLVLTGGDIALQVCGALQISALTIRGQVAPGIPGSQAASGVHAGLAIVTKAGGFGSPQALVHALDWINGGESC